MISRPTMLCLCILVGCSNKEAPIRGHDETSSPQAAGSDTERSSRESAAPSASQSGSVFGSVLRPVVGRPVVGRTERVVIALDFHLTIDGPGLMGNSKLSEQELRDERVERVDQVNDARVTRLRVTYATRREIERQDGTESRRVSTVEGRSYVLSALENAVGVEDEAGKPVTDEERSVVRRDYPTLNELGGPQVGDVGAIHLGQPVPGLESIVRKLLGKASRGEESALGVLAVSPLKEIRLAGGGGRVGAFGIAGRQVFSGSGGEMSADLSGEVLVREDGGGLAAVTLSGPIVMQPSGLPPGVELRGSGSIDFRYERYRAE